MPTRLHPFGTAYAYPSPGRTARIKSPPPLGCSRSSILETRMHCDRGSSHDQQPIYVYGPPATSESALLREPLLPTRIHCPGRRADSTPPFSPWMLPEVNGRRWAADQDTHRDPGQRPVHDKRVTGRPFPGPWPVTISPKVLLLNWLWPPLDSDLPLSPTARLVARYAIAGN